MTRVCARGAAQGASGPVHAVMAENWLVYHYWSAANLRFQVCFGHTSWPGYCFA